MRGVITRIAKTRGKKGASLDCFFYTFTLLNEGTIFVARGGTPISALEIAEPSDMISFETKSDGVVVSCSLAIEGVSSFDVTGSNEKHGAKQRPRRAVTLRKGDG